MGTLFFVFIYAFVTIYLLIKIDIRLFKLESFVDRIIELNKDDNEEV